MPKYTMTVATLHDDGSRVTSFWDISQMTAAVIRGCYGPPAEEILESPEAMAARRAASDDLVLRYHPEKESE